MARRSERDPDRGAAAVEFALVLPVLVLIIVGIIGFGHAYHVQTVLGNAARDGVRILALSDDADAARQAMDAAIASAAPAVTLTDDQITVTPTPQCASGAGVTPGNARVTITLEDFQPLGGFFTLDLTGTAAMRCTG
ncbi:TadE/TadG family type IV pilus assembly protein [Isoptericola variabilis]|uniref:TadE family protein n=1 Tax=Isoptericola variabilis (strain 225) TaxID=743718 RepID=F6FQU3_ISOV2|nr:TadE family protein [Isoptericola variabilis]AEG42908.1 TadE family protein [Isoptericola variabilis 225]